MGSRTDGELPLAAQGTAESPATAAMRSNLREVRAAIERRCADPDGLDGVSTGYFDLDHLTLGLRPGSLTLVGGAPGVGSTSLALALVRNVAGSGAAVLFHTTESNVWSVTQGLLTQESGLRRIMSGYLGKEIISVVDEAVARLGELPVTVTDPATLDLADIGKQARQVHDAAGGLGLIVLDRLDELDVRTGEPIGLTCSVETLRQLARELNTAVVVVIPVKAPPEKRQDKVPRLGDVSCTDDWVKAADLVILLDRPGRDSEDPAASGQLDLMVWKHLQGPLGTVQLHFDGQTRRITPLWRHTRQSGWDEGEQPEGC